MKHTPGPWVVYKELNVTAGKRGVAQCGGYQGNVGSDAIHGENIANARLIAAAPELLAVCKDLLAFMEQYDLLDWDLADDDQARIDAAFVAIAKAEAQS